MPKAKTKAEKLRIKRGRPRLPATDREPNGRNSRRAASTQHRDQESNMNVAIAQRIRQHELVDMRKAGKVITAVQQALDPKRGYALGLLQLDGKLTGPQHDIGVKIAEDMARYYGTTGVPFPSARAQNLFSIRSDGEDSESRGAAARKARDKMVRIREVLLKVGDIDTGRRVYRAVMSVVVEDVQESRCWPEHMLTYLRMGLNKAGKQIYGIG